MQSAWGMCGNKPFIAHSSLQNRCTLNDKRATLYFWVTLFYRTKNNVCET